MAKETPFDRARDYVEEKIEQTKEVLGDSFEGVGDEVRKQVKQTAKRIEKDYGYIWDDVRGYVKENPGTAVALSAGIGFLLGYLLAGGDED
ncbi:MAG TPA: hypothetical protein VLG15_13235 [Thermoanaerobaculia bacterium]|jgi:ElaB/YqjD/DUF883 family membrane-anchored ribosome-binding protein|nr:hypothetical protein [Thermoanaerobaculia bacterium]